MINEQHVVELTDEISALTFSCCVRSLNTNNSHTQSKQTKLEWGRNNEQSPFLSMNYNTYCWIWLSFCQWYSWLDLPTFRGSLWANGREHSQTVALRKQWTRSILCCSRQLFRWADLDYTHKSLEKLLVSYLSLTWKVVNDFVSVWHWFVFLDIWTHRIFVTSIRE